MEIPSCWPPSPQSPSFALTAGHPCAKLKVLLKNEMCVNHPSWWLLTVLALGNDMEREKIPRHEQRPPWKPCPRRVTPPHSPSPILHFIQSLLQPIWQFVSSEWKPAVCQGSGVGDDLIQRFFLNDGHGADQGSPACPSVQPGAPAR